MTLTDENLRAIGSAPGPRCANCLALVAELQEARKECERLRRLAFIQEREITDLRELADCVEVLRDIGKLVGCGHVDSADGRRQLVNCVEQSLVSATSRSRRIIDRQHGRSGSNEGRTAVTLEWLKGLRRHGGDMSWLRVRLTDTGFHLMSPCAAPSNGIDGLNNYVAPRPATRDDVRMLAMALGIELDEGVDEPRPGAPPSSGKPMRETPP